MRWTRFVDKEDEEEGGGGIDEWGQHRATVCCSNSAACPHELVGHVVCVH